MSTFRYCVLWIPTRLHQKIRPISHELNDRGNEPFTRIFQRDKVDQLPLIDEPITLSDILVSDEADEKVYVDLTLLKEGLCTCGKVRNELVNTTCSCFIPKRDILIKAKKDGKVFDTLYLHCLDARRNGLFMYEYEVDKKYSSDNTENKYLLNSNKNITNVIYHSIKSFYHAHEFHGGDQDSILHPFSSDVKINLNCLNNPALLHYLDEFEKIFNDEDDFTTDLKVRADRIYNEVILEENHPDFKKDKVSLHNNIERIKTGYIECIKQCDKVLNMHVYYQALFYSKHNTMFNLRYVDSYKYELSEECQLTGQKRKSALTLKACNNLTNPPQLLIPNKLEKSTTYILSNECYKKAINIHNAIESISLRQKELSNRINWIFLEFIDELLTGLISQTENIQNQTVAIQNQAEKVENQTIEIASLTKRTGDLSSKLTKRMTLISIAVGILASVVITIISTFFNYSPKNDMKALNDSLTDTRNQMQEKFEINNQQIEEVKKLLINLNSEVKKKSGDKKKPARTSIKAEKQ